MAWLIGVICVVIVIMFWRIFLPLGVLAAVGITILFLVIQHNDRTREEEKENAATELRQKIAKARDNAKPARKRWRVIYKKDPASDVEVARVAYIESNDSLCTLSVQKRLNGAQLTGLDCPDFNISEWDDIEVKFSNAESSVKMDLKSYGNSKDVYIPSYQSDYSGYLDYEEFIARLKNGKAIAIKIPSAGGIWMTFSLEGSPEALNQLGKEKSEEPDVKGSSEKVIASSKALEDQLRCKTNPSPGKAIRAMMSNGLLKETELGADGIPVLAPTTVIYVFGTKITYVTGWEFDKNYSVKEPFGRGPGTAPPVFIAASFDVALSDIEYKEQKNNADGSFSSIDKGNPNYRNPNHGVTITCYAGY